MEVEKTEVYNPESLTSATDAPEQTENNKTPVQISNGAGVGGNLQSVVQIRGMRPSSHWNLLSKCQCRMKEPQT